MPLLRIIPAGDRTFEAHVRGVLEAGSGWMADSFQARLRRLYPHVTVRERGLSGESASWYVYKHGRWTPPVASPWWDGENGVLLWADPTGWLLRADAQVRDLLGIPRDWPRRFHVSEFAAPGTDEDVARLWSLVENGGEFEGTVRVRPLDGQVIEIDVHARRTEGVVRIAVRLSAQIADTAASIVLPGLVTEPVSDDAFRRYAVNLIASGRAQNPSDLAVALHMLYPHAEVSVDDGVWVVRRGGSPPPADDWTADGSLPHVTYAGDGVILRANDAARELLGQDIVGRHWQELVTAGSASEIEPLLAMIREAGVLVSRFRMPDASGSLVEFDSWNAVTGPDVFETVMRPLDREAS